MFRQLIFKFSWFFWFVSCYELPTLVASWCLFVVKAIHHRKSEDETVEAPRRSTQLRKCPGCLMHRNSNTWSMPHKDCKGPPVNTSSILSALDNDIGLSQLSDVSSEFQKKHGIPDFEFDDFGISCLTPSRNFKKDYDLVHVKEPKSTDHW